jgi:hypothetical protein
MSKLLSLILFFLLISCSNNENDKLIGKYSIDDTCKVTIEITKINGKYLYELKGRKINKKGELVVNRGKKETYLHFDDLSGLLESDSLIVMQNYGNSMNQYLNIAECDIKYLNFAKTNRK